MIAMEKCPFCEEWQVFEKADDKDNPYLPWVCPECGEQVMKFPERSGKLGKRVDNIWA